MSGVRVPLTNGGYTLVSKRDAARVRRHKWYSRKGNKTRYACGYLSGAAITPIDLHRWLLQPLRGVIVDHRDRNGLNNQRRNLRLCTQAQNQANGGAYRNSKSGVRGVSWNERRRKWQAFAKIDGRNRYLGSFTRIEEAARAYKRATRKAHGRFAEEV